MAKRIRKKARKKFTIAAGPLAGHVVNGPLVQDERVREEVLKLHRIMPFSYEDIADALTIGEATVRIIIERKYDPGYNLDSEREQMGFPGFEGEEVFFCRSCGSTVRKPCLACWLAQQPSKPLSSLLSKQENLPDSLALNLPESSKMTYQLIRRKKESMGLPD